MCNSLSFKYKKIKSISIIIGFLFITSICYSQTYVKVADKPLYEKYLAYCNKMVLDTVFMVGYKTIPTGKVTYVNKYTFTNPDGTKVVRLPGTYITQKRVLKTNSYNNQLRKRTYKNINKKVTTLPTSSATRAICWSPITYYCLQRKPSAADFYNWYYKLPIKP